MISLALFRIYLNPLPFSFFNASR